MDYVINLYLVSSSSSLVDGKVAERKKLTQFRGGYQVTGLNKAWGGGGIESMLAMY